MSSDDPVFTEIQPQVRPRDQGGKFVAQNRPEPMLAPRALEGDPDTGDTRDGGADPRFVEAERRAANGWTDEREEFGEASAGETGQNRQPARQGDRANARHAPADDGYELQTGQQDRIFDVDQSEQYADDDGRLERSSDRGAPEDGERADAEGNALEDAEGGQRYEVIVNGSPREVSLNEALRGYVRQETFHQRMQQLNTLQTEVENEQAILRNNWALWHRARQAYEDDVAHMLPKEPDWDEEYRRNPQAAYETNKIFQALYKKLADSRQERANREAADTEENNRRTQKYAVDGFSRFVIDNKIPDEPTLKKEIQSMRRTAQAAGFSEYEVATVYDPRMLTILRKASKYDRMMAANRPQPLNPSKGRSLPPGAATPLGNAGRKGLDEAQRRLASSGRLDDAADVFRRMF